MKARENTRTRMGLDGGLREQYGHEVDPAPAGRRNRALPDSGADVGPSSRRPYVADIVFTACKAWVAERIATHGLRHTYASHYLMRGVSLMAVKELHGHESIEMASGTATCRRT